MFPGGNVSAVQDQDQDGGGADLPPPEDIRVHFDATPYRRAAIRELFEESGILLAQDRVTGRPVHVPVAERERGRRAVHNNEVRLVDWVRRFGEEVVPDTGEFLTRLPRQRLSNWWNKKKKKRIWELMNGIR